SLLAIGVISGSLMAHLTKLGIEVQGDRGLLFFMAVITFACATVVAWLHRREIPLLSSHGWLRKVTS
ncbi:MAG: DoxX family protein, partial [Acidobacteria bacterium]|nr:DoxX family protein [Acidobacteriota bacterium]